MILNHVKTSYSKAQSLVLFTDFSKTTQNSEMCFTSLETPNIWLLWASSTGGVDLTKNYQALESEPRTFSAKTSVVTIETKLLPFSNTLEYLISEQI